MVPIFTKIIFFKNAPGNFLAFVLGVLVSPKINHIGFGGLDTSPNPEIVEMRVFAFSHN